MTEESKKEVVVDLAVVNSAFASQVAKKSLRITCYGSSSAKTPEKYLKEARSLGYTLAKRGHVCVNGAGSFGCMAAMNDGALAGNGHVVGVIHSMFLVDGGYGVDGDAGAEGAHQMFAKTNPDNRDGPIREILVAGGDDLQERKKMLVDKADALVVLPGGPGTWDELWEMACSRHLGLVKLPIVCVNVDNFYEPFREMLERAHEDELIKLLPEQIVHFASNSEEAIRWIEEEIEGRDTKKIPALQRRMTSFRGGSFYSTPPFVGAEPGSSANNLVSFKFWSRIGLTFAAGMVLGVTMGRKKS